MEFVRTLMSRCKALFGRHELDRSLDEELCAHIDPAIAGKSGASHLQPDAAQQRPRSPTGVCIPRLHRAHGPGDSRSRMDHNAGRARRLDQFRAHDGHALHLLRWLRAAWLPLSASTERWPTPPRAARARSASAPRSARSACRSSRWCFRRTHGSPCAARSLVSILYGTSARDPWVLAGSVRALTLIAGSASVVPALRAARIDPRRALRTG
jgi:hypothetical protein